MIENSEVKRLAELAHQYHDKAKYSPREMWTDVLKAHTLYNACAHRCSDEQWNRLAYDVQNTYWKEDVSLEYGKHVHLTQDFQRQLDTIRNTCRQELVPIVTQIDGWEYGSQNLHSPNSERVRKSLCDEIRKFSKKANTGMKVLCGKIIQAAIDLCKRPPPCKFAAVAMGSLAKEEGTPYSDLEFMFLVERKDPDIVSYFELLAMTVYFLIGNCQETKLKYMNIKELKGFHDRCKNGFKIDGLQSKAGNIPTGNGTPEQKNKFIMTPEELIEKYQSTYQKPIHKEAIKGDFTAMLAHTTIIFEREGKHLLKQFTDAKSQIKASEERIRAHHAMLQQDINDYNFLPLSELRDKNLSVNLKSDIYRFPSILIYNLKIVCNIDSLNSWETVKILIEKKILSQTFGESVRFLLACALFIRLAAYLHHDSQNEDMTFVPESQLADTSDEKSHFWHLPPSLAFHMSLHLVPVKASMAFKSPDQIFAAMAAQVDYETELVAANYCYQTENYIHAKEIFEKLLQNRCNVDLLGKLAYCYLGLQQWEKFQSTVRDILRIPWGESIVTLYWTFKAATGFRQQGDLENANKRFVQVVKWLDKLEHKRGNKEAMCEWDVQEMYLHAASFYAEMNDASSVQKYLDKSSVQLEKDRHILDESKYNKRKSSHLQVRAALLIRLAEYSEAEKIVLENHALLERTYGKNARNFAISGNLQALGNVYNGLGQHEKAKIYAERAKKVFEELAHSSTLKEYAIIVTYYSNQALIYEEEGDYENALKKYQLALDILEKDSNYHITKIADMKRRIGFIFRLQGNITSAEKYLKEAIEIFSKIKTADAIIHRARCHFDMAKILQLKGRTKEAMKYFEEVTTLFDLSDTNTRYQDLVIECYSSIGDMHGVGRDYPASIQYYQKALNTLPLTSFIHKPGFVTIIYLNMCTSLQRDKLDLASIHHTCVQAVKFLKSCEDLSKQTFTEYYLLIFSRLCLNAIDWILCNRKGWAPDRIHWANYILTTE